ncbi:hypothetical protein ACTWJ8_40180 (plasmid) [Streptomyces sp. SDT5-1]|uniref:hypothetical protein n=1 Tax=Streptomyces sp. SDT5-1 TaxID=3406418 RepID=UPI003FD5A8C7
MEQIPLALTGYLDTAAVPGDTDGTASFRIISSPADCTAEQEALIPCTTSQPQTAHALLHDCEPSDLLRVTGRLTLPGTADGPIRLDVDTIDVLWEAPQTEQPPETPADHSDRNRAIHALAEALTGIGYEPAAGEQPDICINIGPAGVHGLDVAHCHSIDVTTAATHRLADAIDAMLASRQPPRLGISLHPLAGAQLAKHFDELDLTALTRAVYDLLGDMPVNGIDDSDP